MEDKGKNKNSDEKLNNLMNDIFGKCENETDAEKNFKKEMTLDFDGVFGKNPNVSKEEHDKRLKKLGKKLCDTDYNNRILKGYILDAEDLILFIKIYSTHEYEMKSMIKINYCAFLLNKYYPNDFNDALELSIKEELYEDAALFTKLMKVVDMPSRRI